MGAEEEKGRGAERKREITHDPRGRVRQSDRESICYISVRFGSPSSLRPTPETLLSSLSLVLSFCTSMYSYTHTVKKERERERDYKKKEMSLKQGFVLGMGALAGGALGFYIQDRFMAGYREEQGERIEKEARRRFEALRNGARQRQHPADARADIVMQAGIDAAHRE